MFQKITQARTLLCAVLALIVLFSQEPVLLNGLTDLLKKIPELFDELQTNGILTEKTRLKCVKVCISDLVEMHGL